MDYIGRALVADALREWREQLHDHASASPLRDLDGARARLIDIRAGHPSGLAQLFASRPTAVSAILRDPQVREAGLHRARLMLDEAERVRAATGAWTAALVVGTVAWTEGERPVEMPLLMRAIELERYRSDDVQVTLGPQTELNPVFHGVLRERAAVAGRELSLPQVAGGSDFDPRPLWDAVRELTDLLGEDLEVRDRLLLGAFDDPEQRLLDDLDDCDPVIAGSTVLAAAAGDHDARGQLGEPLPAFPRGDRDPFAERGVGDLDDVQFAVLDLVATGRDVFLQCPPGADAVGMAAALAADGAASGRTVGVIGGAEGTLAAIASRLRALGAADLVVDATVPSWNAEARSRLLESITMGTPPVDDAALRASGETLLRTRAELHRRFDALHRSHRPWGVSAFEAVQAIVRLTTSEPAPATGLRLSTQAGTVVAEHGFASVASALSAVVRPPTADAEPEQERQPAPVDTSGHEPWWTAVAEPEQGARLDEALATLLGRVVPKLRAEAAIAAHETGVDEAGSMLTWIDQVHMFEDLREILEIFSPAVFHRSLHDLVAATAPHGSPRHVDLPRRERRALMRRAVELLRPGRGKESLHADLVRAHELALRWRSHCSAGGWPAVPDDYDIFTERVAEATALWETLRVPVETVGEEAEVASQPWDDMVNLLDRLGQGLPGMLEFAGAEPLEIDVEATGFSPLIDDLRGRDASDAQVRRDLEFAWWAAAFDAIVTADPSLTEYGALGDAVERFRGADASFAESRIGPLMRAAAERRRTAIARHPDVARDLFAALVEGGNASIKELWRDYGALTSALRPVLVSKAEQVSRLAPPTRVFDVVVLVASESLALAELVPALARAKQVVVVGDAHAATRSAVAALASMLPRVTLHATPQPRDVRVTAVLSRAAYGRSLEALPAAQDAGAFAVHHIDGVGAPVAGSSVVESTRAEVAAVVEHVERAHASLPRRSLQVIAGNELHASRIRDALAERSARLAATVPVAALGDVAGPVVDEAVLALGFARDARGTAPELLGVLSEPWGHEALVQALVATRERLEVFTALDPTHLPSDSPEGAGVDDLRDLLHAASERAIPPERPEPAPSDWLLADVAQRLRLQGYGVHVRYGAGPDAVPMVVGGKRERGYRVAVVTDEAAPAGSASLRDRMRWQRASLEALGWTVVPLWTIDVFMDPDAAAAQVVEVLEHTDPSGVQDALEIELPPVAQAAPVDDDSAPEADGDADVEVTTAPAPEVDADADLEAADTSAPGADGDSDRPGASALQDDRDLDDDPATASPTSSDDEGDEDEAGGDDGPAAASAPDADDDREGDAASASAAEVPGMLDLDGLGDDGAAGDEGDDPDPDPERDPEPESSAGPAPVPPTLPVTSRGADRPLIPTRAREDLDESWGGADHDSRDDEILRERPPHW